MEETQDTIYLVLPSASPLVREGAELGDRELDAGDDGLNSTSDGSLTCANQATCQQTCGLSAGC